MITVRLSSKGQLVLPAALRASRAWAAGTAFEVLETADGVLLKPVAPSDIFPPTQLADVFGVARHAGAPLSIEDMHAAVQAEAARR
jgi:AbrB family looped-hinge helix DNA binding protein